jgi:N-acetylglucosaminyl-diphospho-decaprenol L-rhamnosyltransferase
MWLSSRPVADRQYGREHAAETEGALKDTDLAVIVVSYNTRDMLRCCLRSVYCQGDSGLRVVVVDNASTDGSPEMVRLEYPSTQLLALERNLGFAAANNVALRALGLGASDADAESPEYVLFLNPDTEVCDDAMTLMRDFLRRTPAAGVVGPTLIYPDGSFQHSGFRFPTLCQIWFEFFAWPGRFVESPLNGRYPRALYVSGQPFEVDHPLGAAFMARATVIQQVGLMDETFFMYAEEIDWCMRVRCAGWRICCLPSATIVHHGGGSTRQYRDHMNAALWRSRFRLFDKHYNRPFNWAARVLVWLGRQYQAGRARSTSGAAR